MSRKGRRRSKGLKFKCIGMWGKKGGWMFRSISCMQHVCGFHCPCRFIYFLEILGQMKLRPLFKMHKICCVFKLIIFIKEPVPLLRKQLIVVMFINLALTVDEFNFRLGLMELQLVALASFINYQLLIHRC